MENKNKSDGGLKEILENEIVPKLDPKNEISAAPEEKLVAEQNKDGIVAGLSDGSVINSRINQRSSGLRTDRPVTPAVSAPENIEGSSRETENSYGSFNDNPNRAGGSKKKGKLPILLIVGVLFFVAVVAAAMYILKQGGMGKDKESPQDIIKSSLNAMREVKTYSTSGNINMKYSLSGGMIGEMMYEIGADMKGKTDVSDPKNANSEMNIKLNVGMKGDNGSEDYSVDLEGRSFGMKEVYYKINDFDLGIMGMIIGSQVNSFKGKWYLFDMEEMKNLPGYEVKDGLIYKNYNINKITDIINKYEIFKFSEDLGGAKIGDMDVYHYKTKIDGMAIVYTYLDMAKEMIASGVNGDGAAEMEKDLKKAKDDIENNYKGLIGEGFQNIESEVWIGKTDKLIYRMKVSGTLSEEYLRKVMDAMTGSSAKKALDTSIKSKVSRLRTEIEIYYDDNNGTYENYKPSTYSGLKPENVRSNKGEYVIWSDLATTEDKWCVDSTGRSGYVLGGVDGYKCPEFLTSEPIGADKPIDRSGLPAATEPKMNINFSADISNSDFNKPVTIEKPEGAVNFFQEMSKGGLMPNPSGTGGSSDSDNDELDDYMESYYKTDPNNADTDGDGYKDGVEVRNGYDPKKPGSAKLEIGW